MHARILCKLYGALFALIMLLSLRAIAGDTIGVTVSGIVQYKNTSNTPVAGVRIIFAGFDTVTGPDGRYSFFSVAPGKYLLGGMKTGNAAGINALDALIVMRYFLGLMPLDSLNRLAADVTNNDLVNAADAWFIVHHIVTDPALAFPRGDWVFLPQIVIIRDSNVTVNLPALCVGDVDGSFVPHEP